MNPSQKKKDCDQNDNFQNKLCDAAGYEICSTKSFASHPKAKFWSRANQMVTEKKDAVCDVVHWMVRRDEEDNPINPGLNELESRLFLKIQSEHHNSSVGESIMSAYHTELLMELGKTVAAVAKKFEILLGK